MKNKIFKQIMTGLMLTYLVCWSFIGSGATVAITPGTAATNSLVSSNSGLITQISLTSTAGVAFVVSLYDAPALTLTYTNYAWTNYTLVERTNTTAYVDILNNTNTISYRYLTNVSTVMSNLNNTTWSNNFRLIGTFAAPAGTTVTIPYITANPFFRGLMATNNVGGSLSVQYLPSR